LCVDTLKKDLSNWTGFFLSILEETMPEVEASWEFLPLLRNNFSKGEVELLNQD
jgi:hypothetical protein